MDDNKKVSFRRQMVANTLSTGAGLCSIACEANA